MQRKLNLATLSNERQKNESFEDYKIRLKNQKAATKNYKKGDLVHVSAVITKHLNEDNTEYYTKSKGKTFKGNVKKQLTKAIF
jgi:hypothetical protein